jgi:hypothetical protein
MTTALSIFGAILMALGIWQGFDAITMNVLVTPPDGSPPVANFQMMQVQLMSVILACGMFGSGIIMVVGACIVSRLAPPETSEERLARIEETISNG